MALHLEVAQAKSKMFNPFDTMQVPRDQDTQADALANLGSSLRDVTFIYVPIIHLMIPAIRQCKGVTQLTTMMPTKQEMTLI